MFATKLAFAAISALSSVHIAGAMPTGLMPREDWKTALGWDGKVTTPVQLDPNNAVKPTPGKPAPAVLNGGVFFCTNSNFSGRCVSLSDSTIAIKTVLTMCRYYRPISGQCVGVGSDFNDVVSSFGPDPGLTCTIYR
ncbi:hypothetical protein FRC10_003247 [Ceratobasidium sp. 414]|nr:hypothetical protein FRC10_003247 [Ceratobasidium sp. 414]